MKPALKWTLITLAVVLVGGQAVRPDRSNPPTDPSLGVEAHLEVPADVSALLERSCVDCHSNSTRWPWYSGVAPTSWLVAYHVNHGREYVNFDTWGDYTAVEAQDVLGEIAEVVERGEMPLRVYPPLHPRARLDDADRARLAAWATAERDRLLREGLRTGP